MSRPNMTFTRRDDGEDDGIGVISYPFEERPVFHARSWGENWERSACGLASIGHRQNYPVGHLMWFARPCKRCWKVGS